MRPLSLHSKMNNICGNAFRLDKNQHLAEKYFDLRTDIFLNEGDDRTKIPDLSDSNPVKSEKKNMIKIVEYFSGLSE